MVHIKKGFCVGVLKNSFLLAFLFFAVTSASVNFSLSASSGDKEFDLNLSNINNEAKTNLPEFYGSMEMLFGTSSRQIDYLLYKNGFSPADAFMALKLSILIGRPVDFVIKSYKVNKKQGWGAIAKELGIKPGSNEFHQLKNGSVLVLEESRKKSGGGKKGPAGDGKKKKQGKKK
jgi:hypothetical protein